MYRPQHILSKNRKTGTSLDLPIKGHCHPTKNCSHDCYAKSGPQAYPASVRKHTWVSNYLRRGNIDQLTAEARQCTAVRLLGSGDFLATHTRAIVRLAKLAPSTQFWGMTRKPDIARRLNGRRPNLRILVTVDASSPRSTWRYKGRLCYGPRRSGDTVPNDSRIVTVFPRHFAGRLVGSIPHHRLDCPAIRHTVPGCHACTRCWNWKLPRRTAEPGN